MYSKEVMEHFQHPHHMGEMKNPDGTGRIGNPVCLPPGIMIHKNDEFAGIETIENSTKVLGHNGTFNSVERTFSRKYSGKLIKIKNKLGTTLLTPEHEVLAMKVPKEDFFYHYKNKKNLKPAFYHAIELKKRDVILYPILKEEVDREFIEIKLEKKKYDFRSKDVPEKIRVDADFLRFCGYYLAEGYLKDKVTKTYISFAFHMDETHLADDVERISQKIFGIEVKRKIIKERKTLHVSINNVFIVRLIKSFFGKGAAEKKIPHWMMVLPIEKQKALIEGLWKGDGYFNAKRPRAGYSTISYKLAQQLKTLLLRQKIVPSIHIDKEKISKDGVKHRKAFRIHIGQRESLIKLAKILGINFVPEIPQKTHSWFDDKYLYTPITEVSQTNYMGKVYNLKVENSASYVTESLAVHNCGDVMEIYIKVEKGKDGKERLKDIKVKTFGCVAAIATSSMITDMAMGKTLEEALKISNRDIASALKGLPPIKMHCSVLAADALHKAIDDYRKRQGAKRLQSREKKGRK